MSSGIVINGRNNYVLQMVTRKKVKEIPSRRRKGSTIHLDNRIYCSVSRERVCSSFIYYNVALSPVFINYDFFITFVDVIFNNFLNRVLKKVFISSISRLDLLNLLPSTSGKFTFKLQISQQQTANSTRSLEQHRRLLFPFVFLHVHKFQ